MAISDPDPLATLSIVLRRNVKIIKLQMKINKDVKVNGRYISLVPYEEHHVPKYHEWMKSEELQKLTASEPLSLEEEYAMQKCWRQDEDKCTFIILDQLLYEQNKDEIASMIGDTNIFVTNDENTIKGEIEIMLAEPMARGRKLGWEAVILMLLYGTKFIDIQLYAAKISFSNLISLKMFEKLGFVEVSNSDVFKEKTLEKIVDTNWIDWLEAQVEFKICSYN